MMRVLVTGGAGFIGSNFIRSVLKKYSDVAVLNYDKLTYAGNLENLKDIADDKRYKFVKGDIADLGLLAQTFHNFEPDYVVNFAAETHVDKSIHGQTADFVNSNIVGVFNLLELARVSSLKKYLQVSTDEVYGSLPLEVEERFEESSHLHPNSPYAATKASADLLCQAYFATFGLPIVIARSSNNFGPYQHPEKLIPFFVLKMIEGKKLPLYGDGKNVRDWLYVLDNCEALELCLLKGKAGEIYNISAGNELSNLEVAREIVKHFGRDESWLEFVADRPGHDRRYALDSSKIVKELGWQSKYDFRESLHETIKWYLNNRSWLDSTLKKGGRPNPHL